MNSFKSWLFILSTSFVVLFGSFLLIGAKKPPTPSLDAELISIGLDGQAGSSGSYYTFNEAGSDAISADGRYIVFSSTATNLTEHDVSNWHVYLRDRETDTTTLVTNTGETGTIYGSSIEGSAVISADGRYVAFQSTRSGLVPIDNNGAADIFVYDRINKTLEIVSVDDNGSLGSGCSCGWPDYCNGCESHLVNSKPSISADGRFVAFGSFSYNFVDGDLPDTPDVFVHDREKGTTTIISKASDGNLGNSGSSDPSISADGNYVAFSSKADNLDPEDFNEYQDIFIWCRTTNSLRRISISSEGEEGNLNSQEPAISADGSLIAFTSGATNLAGQDTNGYTSDIFVRNEIEGTTTLLSYGLVTGGRRPSISDDGEFVSFTTGRDEVQLQNLTTGQRRLISNNMQFSALDEKGSVIVMSGYDAILPTIDTNGDKDVYLVSLSSDDPPTGETEICDDDIDNDGDGLFDCDDRLDCRQTESCMNTGGGGSGGGGGGGGQNR